MMGLRYAENFIKESQAMGYVISGSVFKVDYNGKNWTVGFWIRPTRTRDWKEAEPYYNLVGRCGKASKPNFDEAVLAAIAEAKKGEQ